MDMTDMVAVEMGQSTGHVSAWMARRGATVTAIENSQRQPANWLGMKHRLDFIWLHGHLEQMPRRLV